MSRSRASDAKVASRRAVSRSMFSVAGGVALAFGIAGSAFAQQDDGPIMIPGNAETNPAAVAGMAKSAGMMGAPGASGASGLSTPRPRGYAAASTAADAAMRSAARALDAHADAADDSMSNASGMIVIPGPGEVKNASAAQKPATDASGMITIPGPGEVKNASAAPNAVTNPNLAGATGLPRVRNSPATTPVAGAPESASIAATRPIPASAARDVIPVVVAPESAAPLTRTVAARPIAAAPAAPVVARAAPAATAQPATATTAQDGESIRAAALAFVQQQTAGLPGKPEITVTPVFPRGLAPCVSLDPFMPTGARLWGRTTVGVRCTGERPWTLYVQVRISINATYYLAARAIAPGEVLTSADLIARDGDLTTMPQAIVTDPTQAVGAVALSRVPAGLPLRTDMLRGASSVAIGQNVHVVADGSGFSISAEGSAMNNAAPGQQVRVKTSAGQIITGIVKDSQTVEIRL
jgi:flagellar basal body P-ring formation protein FlgA